MNAFSSVLLLSTTMLCLMNPSTFAWIPRYDYVMVGTVLDVFYSSPAGEYPDTEYIDPSVSCYIAMDHENPSDTSVTKYNGEFHEAVHYEVCEYAEMLMRRGLRVNFYGLHSVQPSNPNANNYVVGLEAAGKNVRWSPN